MLNIIIALDIGVIMTNKNCNCIVCAEEFDCSELQSVILSEINATKFKICNACLEMSDPADDYKQAREIVDSYLKFSEAKHFLVEAKEILNSIKK